MKGFRWSDMGLVVLGRVAQAALALIALRMITTFLSVEEMGRWSVLMATITFFTLGFVSPCGMFINRRLHAWVVSGAVVQYIIYYLGYLVFVAVLASITILSVNLFYTLVPGMDIIWIITLGSITIVFGTLNQTFIPSLNMLGYRGWFVFLTLMTGLMALSASILLVYLVVPKAEVWQLGQLVGQFVLSICGGWLFFVLVKRHHQKDGVVPLPRVTVLKLKSVLRFVWPLAISVILMWVQTQSYRFVIQDLVGLEALGMFVVGYGVSASLIGMFESVISTYFLPKFYKRTSSEDELEQSNAWSEYASVMIAGLLLALAAVVSMSEELTRVLLDAKFAAAADFVIWGALAEAFRVVVATYALIAHAKMDTKKLIVPNLVGALAAPILVYLFASEWGSVGIGAGLALAGLMVFLSMNIILLNSFSFRVPWVHLLKSLLLAGTMVAIASGAHRYIGGIASMFEALIWLACMGGVLLVGLYYTLAPFIGKELVK